MVVLDIDNIRDTIKGVTIPLKSYSDDFLGFHQRINNSISAEINIIKQLHGIDLIIVENLYKDYYRSEISPHVIIQKHEQETVNIWILGNFEQENQIVWELSEVFADFYVEFTLKSKDGDLRKRAYSQVKSVLKKPKSSSVEMSVVQIDETNKQAVLRITSNSFLRDVWIYSRNGKFHVEDNFFDLLPGNKLVKISFDELSDLDTLGIFYR